MSIRKFDIGQLMFTRGINERIEGDEEFTKFVALSFAKYNACNWGDSHKEDKELNDKAIRNDWRIVAKYNYDNIESIFIITEYDRSYTTILFSHEY